MKERLFTESATLTVVEFMSYSFLLGFVCIRETEPLSIAAMCGPIAVCVLHQAPSDLDFGAADALTGCANRRAWSITACGLIGIACELI